MILPSSDNKLIFSSSKDLLTVFNVSSCSYICEIKVNLTLNPYIEELKNGDAYFILNEVRYKYSRKANSFAYITRGIHVTFFRDWSKPRIGKTLGIYNNGQLVDTIHTHTTHSFKRHNKRNIYFIRQEGRTFKFYKAVFNAKEGTHKEEKSDYILKPHFGVLHCNIKIIVNEEKGVVLFKVKDILYEFNMHTMKFIRSMVNVSDFNEKHIIVRAPENMTHLYSTNDFKFESELASYESGDVVINGNHIMEIIPSTENVLTMYNFNTRITKHIPLTRSPFTVIESFVPIGNHSVVIKRAFSDIQLIRFEGYDFHRKASLMFGEYLPSAVQSEAPPCIVHAFMNHGLFDINLMQLIFGFDSA